MIIVGIHFHKLYNFCIYNFALFFIVLIIDAEKDSVDQFIIG